ncbi:gasdermin-E-like isoform X2 [Triplophysa dalaica]|nr:gasdermin-E-like isoform X2 [Triplophysa dalaica]XP_056597091.1 gasdermin-E-like isoform X2 [Triplophysa dalaica]XP_056597092.1 gasdermin-E-like isoform X2 [Triplophysa dalaica]
MLDKAIKQLVRQSDPDGDLIPASFNDSRKLELLAVVWKKPKTWFFGKDKYRVTDFDLNHLLEKGCRPIEPERKEGEFLKLNATYQNYGSGSVEVGDEALNVTGLGSSKLHFSFDTLGKEYMDIPKLLEDSQGRKVDLSHGLIKQFLKGKLLLTLLKERIFTTCESTISYSGQEQGSCSSTLKGHSKMMSMKAKGELKRNSDQIMTIPARTVVAYSVIKMMISSDGYIELCFEPDGIESDDISEDPDYSEVDGPWGLQKIEEGCSISSLKTALLDVQTRFCVLTDLTSECRSTLLLNLREILLDQTSLSVLVDRLEVLRRGEDQLLQNEFEDENDIICEVLELLSEPDNSEQILVAMHKLLSAIEELTDDGLQLLESFCSPEGLRSLQDLVNLLMANSEPLSKDTIPVFLQKEDTFHRVVDLFKSCNVLLKREDDLMFADVTCEKGFLPYVLCIAISGLSCLIDGNV